MLYTPMMGMGHLAGPQLGKPRYVVKHVVCVTNPDGSVSQYMGDLLSDAGDIISSAANDVGSFVTNLPVLGGAVGAAADAIGNLAKTAAGQAVLLVISGGAYAAAVPFVGPQLAAATFAIPGLVAGDPFGKAWLDGFTTRLTALVAYLAGAGVTGAAVPQPIQDLTNTIVQQTGTAYQFISQNVGPDVANWTEAQVTAEAITLSTQLGIRQDAAFYGIIRATGNTDLLTWVNSLQFDANTGALTNTSKIMLSGANVIASSKTAVGLVALQQANAAAAAAAQAAKNQAQIASSKTAIGLQQLQAGAGAPTPAVVKAVAPVVKAATAVATAGMSTGAKVGIGAAVAGVLAYLLA